MLRNFLLAIGLLCGIIEAGLAQSALIPYDREYYHLLDRYEILKGAFVPHYQTGFKPLRRDHVATFLDEVDETATGRVDQFNFRYLRNDNWEFVDQETALSKKPL